MSDKLEVKDAAAKTNEEIVDSLKQEKQKIREIVKQAIQNIHKYQLERTTDGYYTDRLMKCIDEVYWSYYKFKNQSFEICEGYRRELLEDIIMAKDNIIIIFCSLSKDIMQIGHINSEGNSDEGLFNPLNTMLQILWNTSDSINPEVCKTILDQTEFISLMVNKLTEMAPNILNETSKANDITLIECFLGLTHNLGQLEESIKALREVGIVDAVKPYLNSKKESHKQKTLAILADVVNEEESEILKSSEDTIKWTINSLEIALNDNLRRNEIGWSVRETVRTIRKVAKDDNNKTTVYTCGAVPILVKVADQSDNTEEQKEAVEALWTLSFDESIQAAIIHDPNCKVITTFVKLYKCSEDNDLRKICCRALWTMNNSLKNSIYYKKVGEDFSFNPLRPSASERRDTQIMISYNWGHQSTAKNICCQLRKHGIKVWMDIDDMRGSTVEAMAHAVEKADIILMCYSQYYKNSNFCRSEAEYAFQLNKTVIPLKMENTYKPDGWLGFIIGAKLYYDFSGHYPFEKKITELINDVQIIIKEQNPEPQQLSPVASVSSKVKAVNVHTMKSSDLEKVKKWSPEDVTKWLNKNLLESCLRDKLGGLEIAFLNVLVNESPDVFYKTIVEELNVKGISTTAKLRFALESFDINT